jgi:syndecan 1
VNAPDAPTGVERSDVLAAAVALRWSRPDLTAALAEHLVEEADARADRDAWLVAAGWRLHAVHSVGDGRDVAADLLEEIRRWDDGALATAAADRLRVELAVVAHDAGDTAAASALLALPAAEADAELVADRAVAVARSAGATGEALAEVEAAWSRVGEPRAGTGTAEVRLVAAVTDRRAGRATEAAGHAVAGLTRLDRARASAADPTPSGHLAAALAAEWIAALVDADRWAQAREVIGGLAARLDERTRPTRQLAYLRSTIARVLATDPAADAGEELERAARDAAAADVPDLEHVCRVALGELHEAHGRLEAALESIRLAVHAERRHRARAARLRAALTDLDALLPPVGAAVPDGPDPADGRARAVGAEVARRRPDRSDGDVVERSAVPPAAETARTTVTDPWATGSWYPFADAGARSGPDPRRAAAAGPGRPGVGPQEISVDPVPDTGGTRSARESGPAVTGAGPDRAGAEDGPHRPSEGRGDRERAGDGHRDDPVSGAQGRAGSAAPDRDAGPADDERYGAWRRSADRGPAARSGTASGGGNDGDGASSAERSRAEGADGGRADPTAVVDGAADDVRVEGAVPEQRGSARGTADAGRSAASRSPDGDAAPTTGATAEGSAGAARPDGGQDRDAGPLPVPEEPEVTDPWLAAALAELDRIWHGGRVPAPEAEGCTVVLDLTRGADRLPDGEAAATMRAVAARLDGRLPDGARMRTDSPGALSVVMPGRDRAAASDWMLAAVPDLADGLAPEVATAGTLLRASVHGTDGVVGAQVLQRVGGAAAPSAGGRRTDRFLRPTAPGDQHRGSGRTGPGPARAARMRPRTVRSGASATGDPGVRPDVRGPGAAGGAGGPGAAGSGAAGDPLPGSTGPGSSAPGPGEPRPATAPVPDPGEVGPDAAGPTPAGPVPPVPDAPDAAVGAPTDPEPRWGGLTRRPYLPDGVVVRPGSGGRRYRQPPAGTSASAAGGAAAPARSGGAAAPGGAPPSDDGPPDPGDGEPAAPGGGEPRAGAPDAATTGAPSDAPGAGTTDPAGDRTPPARSAAPAPPDPAGPHPPPGDSVGGQPPAEGLGLADLLAGALAAYRRI